MNFTRLRLIPLKLKIYGNIYLETTRGVTTTKLRLVVVPGSAIKLSSVINFINLPRILSIYCGHLLQREFNLIVCILRSRVVA